MAYAHDKFTECRNGHIKPERARHCVECVQETTNKIANDIWAHFGGVKLVTWIIRRAPTSIAFARERRVYVNGVLVESESKIIYG